MAEEGISTHTCSHSMSLPCSLFPVCLEEAVASSPVVVAKTSLGQKNENHGRCPFIKISSNPTPFSPLRPPPSPKIYQTLRPSPWNVSPLPLPVLCLSAHLQQSEQCPCRQWKRGLDILMKSVMRMCSYILISKQRVCSLHTRGADSHVTWWWITASEDSYAEQRLIWLFSVWEQRERPPECSAHRKTGALLPGCPPLLSSSSMEVILADTRHKRLNAGSILQQQQQQGSLLVILYGRAFRLLTRRLFF